MENININIAGFNISVIFEKSLYPTLENNFKNEIKQFFKGFIIPNPTEKSDYIVQIIDIPNNRGDITQIIKSAKHYIFYYKSVESKKITTFYQISPFQFQIIIQNVLYLLLSRGEGFILHASAAKIDNKAYLFSGKSGSGKSTSVELIKDVFPALSDDFSLIRKETDKYLFYQHPFSEKNVIEGKNLSSLPIGKIVFLRKGVDFKIEKYNDREKAAKLVMQQLMVPNPKNMRSAMRFCSQFNDYFLLHFAKDSKKMIEILKFYRE